MQMTFTFDEYRACLEIGLKRFDRVTGAARFLSEPKSTRADGSVLILRHDCERDLGKAVRMAEIEKYLGISASYFIRIHSEYYNLMLHRDRERVRNIAALGHEIGLHYEPSFYLRDGVEFIVGVKQDLAVLRMILDNETPMHTMSPHQPTLVAPDFAELERHGMVDLYAHDAFRTLSYFSDSGMVWREKNLRQVVETEQRCQLLVHPDFWNDEEIDWIENLDRLCVRCHSDLDAVAAHEKSVLQNYLAKREEHDARFRVTLRQRP